MNQLSVQLTLFDKLTKCKTAAARKRAAEHFRFPISMLDELIAASA
jgi:hypothetical protein